MGYDEGGQLTEAVRRKPYSVVLFDEIEKAHPDVFNVLLQVLDDGRLTDSKGRMVNFKNTIIIMTSNLASDVIQKYANDTSSEEMMVAKLEKDDSKRKAAYDAMREKMVDEVNQVLKRSFKPEFLNRVDDIIIFDSLTIEEITRIVDIQIQTLQKRLDDKKIKIVVTEAAKKHLAQHGFDPSFGARPLKRYIQNHIENPLALLILDGKLSEDREVTVDMAAGQLALI